MTMNSGRLSGLQTIVFKMYSQLVKIAKMMAKWLIGRKPSNYEIVIIFQTLQMVIHKNIFTSSLDTRV